jgi:hypothetical protein
MELKMMASCSKETREPCKEWWGLMETDNRGFSVEYAIQVQGCVAEFWAFAAQLKAL